MQKKRYLKYFISALLFTIADEKKESFCSISNCKEYLLKIYPQTEEPKIVSLTFIINKKDISVYIDNIYIARFKEKKNGKIKIKDYNQAYTPTPCLLI